MKRISEYPFCTYNKPCRFKKMYHTKQVTNVRCLFSGNCNQKSLEFNGGNISGKRTVVRKVLTKENMVIIR